MSSRESEFITRLIALTRQGKLYWEPMEAPNLVRPNGEEFVGVVYLTSIDDDRFRVSRVLVRRYRDTDDFDWEHEVVLELVDPQGRILWRCPKNFAIEHLLEAIEEKNVDIDVLIGKLARIAS